MARIKFYASRILRGRMTLDDVPEKYRTKVKEYLEQLAGQGAA